MADILKFNLATAQSCKSLTTVNTLEDGSIEIVANEDCTVTISPNNHITLKKGMSFLMPKDYKKETL